MVAQLDAEVNQYERELKRYARSCASVQRARRDEKVTVAGIVAALRERPTKTGKRMGWAFGGPGFSQLQQFFY